MRTTFFCAVVLLSVWPGEAQVGTRATSVPLLLPGALTYDGAGNLYFVETANHLVRRVDLNGVLTTVAGTGTQGFGGDDGAATAAMLDSPSGLTYTAPGVLYVADTHNDRVRRIDLRTGLISTIAGSGLRGFSGDGGTAVAARLNLPSALAVDAGGALYVADLGNDRVRRIDVAGVITTIAGNGAQAFAGDGGAAVAASLDSAAGLTVDAAGNVFLADSHNGRVRRVDGRTGTITSVPGVATTLLRGVTVDGSGNLYVAGTGEQRMQRVDAGTGSVSALVGAGTQGLAGDGGPAAIALLDTPGAVGFSPGGLLTIADTGNGRIRQVDAAGIIHTIAGLGATVPGTLVLAGLSVAAYGTGDVTATLVTSPATGTVAFLEGGTTLAMMPLVNNVATLGTDGLAAGTHRLKAVYPGDMLHGAAESGTMALTVAPARATATPDAVAMMYGQAAPVLTGTLTGVLARDAGAVSAVYATAAGMGTVPGVYPITASLTGPATGNYALTAVPASVTVGKAGSTAVLTVPLATVAQGSGLGLSVRVVSATSGTPSGTVTLLDGAQPVGTALLAGGTAGFSPAVLAAGAHTLTAMYAGDGDFVSSTSAPVMENVVVGASSDFTLVATGQTSLTVPAGTAATYSFSVAQVGTPLASPILLTASGLPPGATASFNPAYLPPGNAVQAFVMAVSTPKASVKSILPWTLALGLPWLMVVGRWRGASRFRRRSRWVYMSRLQSSDFAVCAYPGLRSRVLCYVPLALRQEHCTGKRTAVAGLLVILGLAGCGDRINTGTAAGVAVKTYTIAVTGTATDASGATLSHTAKVTLILP